MLLHRNENDTLTIGESALIGFICHLIDGMSQPKKAEKIEDFERLLKTFDLRFCLATGDIIHVKR